jgi:hypothetical protein
MKQYDYKELETIGKKYYADSNFCSVVALSVACNVGYGKAYHTLRRQGRKDKRGVVKPMIDYALEDLGFKAVLVIGYEGKQARSLPNLLPKEGHYLVYFRGHVAAVRDGAIIDWTDNRAHRVRAVYRVIKKD